MKLVEELKKLVSFKETASAGDVVLIVSEEPRMIVYALITAIEPDPGQKKSWWNVTMQVLAVPPREVIWTLREPQFTGREIFTVEGKEHFIGPVRFAAGNPAHPSSSAPDNPPSPTEGGGGLRRVK